MIGFGKAAPQRRVTDVAVATSDRLERFGFSFERGGAHIARTMMLEDLSVLVSYVAQPEPTKTDYLRAVTEENCLGKRSGRTRLLAYRHLADLYSLDPSVTLFHALLYFWQRDIPSRPLVALLCAYARDSVLRSAASFILSLAEGAVMTRESMETYLDEQEPGRFSRATLKSTAQNINGTWTRSGHLVGHVRKVRSLPVSGSGAVAYALFLGFLTGARGQALFQTEYTMLLGYPVPRALELAEEASRRGWIVLKRVKDVVEVLFPNLLTDREMEWVRE